MPVGALAISQLYSEIAGGVTVRYDEATDYVQLLKNGAWSNWRKGNLDKYYLIADGVAQVPFTGNYTKTESSFTVYRTSDTSTGCRTVNVIDATGYTSLVAVVRNNSDSNASPEITMGSLLKIGGYYTTAIQTLTITGITSGMVGFYVYSCAGSFDVINAWLE